MSSNPICRAVVSSPLPDGLRLSLLFDGAGLAAIDFVAADTPCFIEAGVNTEQAVQLLERYFTQPEQLCFSADSLHAGTTFQRRVWQALCAIPSGQTRRYGELAAALGSSARAVAGACRANPLPILIPCHRVVAANGDGGYMGETSGQPLAIKRWLLHHERHVE